MVGLAKGVSPTLESGVAAAGLPHAVVGVIIALLVLLPETIAALRSARRDRVQTSLNLALGSAMASIGLTIPAVAAASVWLPGPLVLGLAPLHMVLLLLTVVVSSLTVVPGRATPSRAASTWSSSPPTWNWRSTPEPGRGEGPRAVAAPVHRDRPGDSSGPDGPVESFGPEVACRALLPAPRS